MLMLAFVFFITACVARCGSQYRLKSEPGSYFIQYGATALEFKSPGISHICMNRPTSNVGGHSIYNNRMYIYIYIYI